jgi:hypothetical protein
MSKKRIAVFTIHGMGSQYKDLDSNPCVPTYSAGMLAKVRNQLGPHSFDATVEWLEIYWADILQPRQNRLKADLDEVTRWDELRKFVIFNLSDAASYFPSRDRDSIYGRVHKAVTETVKLAESMVEPDAPVVILAHSLGGHIISNYLYDLMKRKRRGPGRPYASAFRNLDTFRTLFTFGCNIPIFLLSTGEPVPISYPGVGGEPDRRNWWINFYDKDDVLGYPLRLIGENFQKFYESGQLDDRAINSGSAPASMTPWSHNRYWTDDDVCAAIASELQRLTEPRHHMEWSSAAE